MDSKSNSIVLDYEQWYFAVMDEFAETHTKEDCDDCSGDGELECDCCGHIADCKTCEGDGFVFLDKSGRLAYPPQRNKRAHRLYIIRTFLRLAKFTGRSYFTQCKEALKLYDYPLGGSL